MDNDQGGENEARALGMLGLCARAGQLISGESACELALREGKAVLVLLDTGASANLRKKFRNACSFRGVTLHEVRAGRLGQAIGRQERMVVALPKGSIAERLSELLAIQYDMN